MKIIVLLAVGMLGMVAAFAAGASVEELAKQELLSQQNVACKFSPEISICVSLEGRVTSFDTGVNHVGPLDGYAEVHTVKGKTNFSVDVGAPYKKGWLPPRIEKQTTPKKFPVTISRVTSDRSIQLIQTFNVSNAAKNELHVRAVMENLSDFPLINIAFCRYAGFHVGDSSLNLWSAFGSGVHAVAQTPHHYVENSQTQPLLGSPLNRMELTTDFGGPPTGYQLTVEDFVSSFPYQPCTQDNASPSNPQTIVPEEKVGKLRFFHDVLGIGQKKVWEFVYRIR